MGRLLETIAGLALLAALATGGDAVAAALALPVPGSVLGLGSYLLLLATGRFGWSLNGARLLVGWLGLLIVAPLVAVGGDMHRLAAQALPLALIFVAGVAVTGMATALLYRWAAPR